MQSTDSESIDQQAIILKDHAEDPSEYYINFNFGYDEDFESEKSINDNFLNCCECGFPFNDNRIKCLLASAKSKDMTLQQYISSHFNQNGQKFYNTCFDCLDYETVIEQSEKHYN